MSGELFNPEGVTFKPISMKLITVRILGLLVWTVVLALAIGVFAGAMMFTQGVSWFWLLEIVPIGLLVWQAWGFAESERDLFLRRGIMFKKMWAIPYGRMQFVDVQQGPIDRIFGIAQVSMKTASMESAASIPGLDRDEADRLRKILTARGESLRAGL